MLQALWDFLTNNKDPIDTLLKILTFLGMPIGFFTNHGHALLTILCSTELKESL